MSFACEEEKAKASIGVREKPSDIMRKRRQPFVICTPFTGHPVEGVLLCGTHMSTKGNV